FDQPRENLISKNVVVANFVVTPELTFGAEVSSDALLKVLVQPCYPPQRLLRIDIIIIVGVADEDILIKIRYVPHCTTLPNFEAVVLSVFPWRSNGKGCKYCRPVQSRRSSVPAKPIHRSPARKNGYRDSAVPVCELAHIISLQRC